MLNRAAIILRYKEPAILWINKADPAHDDPCISAADVNTERTVYLISDQDGDSQATGLLWISRHGHGAARPAAEPERRLAVVRCGARARSFGES